MAAYDRRNPGDIFAFTITLSPAAVAANTSAEQIFSTAALLGAGKIPAGSILLEVNKPSAQAGLTLVTGRVSSADNIALTFGNHTAGAITPTAGEGYLVVVIPNFG